MTQPIDKPALIATIIAHCENELDTALAASQTAHESATHSENVAENKYDTLGLEAAYLAHGQSMRIEELQTVIHHYLHFTCPNFSAESPIQAGALVTLIDPDDRQRYIFLSPTTGGMTIHHQQKIVQVVSIQAPLGQALHNKYLDDEITLTIDSTQHSYDVIGLD